MHEGLKKITWVGNLAYSPCTHFVKQTDKERCRGRGSLNVTMVSKVMQAKLMAGDIALLR